MHDPYATRRLTGNDRQASRPRATSSQLDAAPWGRKSLSGIPFTCQASLRRVIRTDRDEFTMGKSLIKAAGVVAATAALALVSPAVSHRGRVWSRFRATRPRMRTDHGIRRHPQPRNAPRLRRMGPEPYVLTRQKDQPRRHTHSGARPRPHILSGQARSPVRPGVDGPRRNSHAARSASASGHASPRSSEPVWSKCAVRPPSSNTRSAP